MSELPLVSLFHIGVSIQHLNKRAERLLGLSLVQWCLLKQLVDMPAFPAAALSGAVGVHPSTLTQTIKRLERKGLIHIATDERDSRRRLVSLTRAGKLRLDQAGRQMDQWQSEFAPLGGALKRIREGLAERQD